MKYELIITVRTQAVILNFKHSNKKTLIQDVELCVIKSFILAVIQTVFK